MRLLNNCQTSLFFKVLCILAGLVIVMTGQASGPDGDAGSPAQRLAGFLTALPSLQANFVQSGGQGEPQHGEIWLRKPNQFRIETAAPLSQTMVSDGESLWTYDRDLEQVVITTVSDTLAEMPILLFAGDPEDVQKTYDIEFFEDETHQYFLLNPVAEDSLLAALSLTFEQTRPVRLVLENTMGERTAIDLEGVTAITTVETGLFTFQAPPDIDVIDDR